MKVIEKIALIIYSNLILIASIIICLIIFRVIDINIVHNMIKSLLLEDVSSKIVLGVSILFILLSIRCIFFDPTSREKEKEKQGILLNNDNGNLLISKETIENLVTTVIKNQSTIHESSTRVELDNENNLYIYVNLNVDSNVIIKNLIIDMQNKIKSKIKESLDLNVKEVNINVKKVVQG